MTKIPKKQSDSFHSVENDEILITRAAATAASIDIKYKRASSTDKVILRPWRDEAFSAYARARLKLLEDETRSSDADVQEMHAIRKQVANARKTQSLVKSIGRFAAFLGRFI